MQQQRPQSILKKRSFETINNDTSTLKRPPSVTKQQVKINTDVDVRYIESERQCKPPRPIGHSRQGSATVRNPPGSPRPHSVNSLQDTVTQPAAKLTIRDKLELNVIKILEPSRKRQQNNKCCSVQ